MQEEIKEPAEMEKAAEKMAEEQEARLPGRTGVAMFTGPWKKLGD